MSGIKQKAYLIFILTALMSGTINGQKMPAKKRYLSIGDTIPDVLLKTINYSKEFVRPSDFKGKLLILDYWATWCNDCVKQFPKLVKMQQKFGDRLAILPIAYDGSKADNELFYKKRKAQGMEIKLPSVVEDSVLTKNFFFNTIPHEIWVNDKGKIIAITGSREVNDSIVQRVLNGEDVAMTLKYVDPDYDSGEPFLIYGNGGPDTSYIMRSVLSRYKPQIRGRSLTSFAHKVEDRVYPNRIFFANRAIWAMYFFLHTSRLYYTGKEAEIYSWDVARSKRIILEGKARDIFSISPPPNSSIETIEQWHRDYFYCYELSVPDDLTPIQVINKAVSDLDNYFNVTSKVEKRKVTYYALVRTSDKDKVKTKGGQRLEKYQSLENDSLKFVNQPISALASSITINSRQLPIIVDSTGYTGNADIAIAFPAKTATIESINKELRRYDLSLIRKEAEMDMLVISGNEVEKK